MHNKFDKEKTYTLLKSEFSDMLILVDEPMEKHTTFKIGGPADLYVEPSVAQVVPLIALLKENNIPYTIIGNGSNLLVSDDGIEGVVIAFSTSAADITINDKYIVAEAGAMLSKVANMSAKEGLTGLEFASGIPGSIGGAVYMNAGAYGGEMKDVLVSVKVLTEDGKIDTIPVDDLDLSYRHSIFMTRPCAILEATLALEAGDKEKIMATIEDIRSQRVAKQPLNFPSAGSTFKRPEGYFAGKLIDDTGLRGYTVGDAQVSEKHCGFVVNKSKATAKDVMRLMQDVDEKVFEKFGVHLTPEVRIIGRNIN